MHPHLQRPYEKEPRDAGPVSMTEEPDSEIAMSLRAYLLALVANHRSLGLSREEAQTAALLECGCSAYPPSSPTRKPPLRTQFGD